MKLLVRVGRKERLWRITGHISPEKTTIKIVSEQVRFSLHFDREADEWFAENQFVRVALFSAKKYDREFLNARKAR